MSFKWKEISFLMAFIVKHLQQGVVGHSLPYKVTIWHLKCNQCHLLALVP